MAKKGFLRALLCLVVSLSISLTPVLSPLVYAASNDAVRLGENISTLSSSEEIEAECQRRITSLVKKIIATRQSDGSPLTIELMLNYIYYWLRVSAEYDDEGLAMYKSGHYEYRYINNKYGPIIYGETVCSGFSEAFKAIVDELARQTGLDLKCEIAISEDRSHAWNRVKFNGNWYHIDVTWLVSTYDSKTGNYFNHYFLISDGKIGRSNYRVASSVKEQGSIPTEKATDDKYENETWPTMKTKDLSEYEIDFDNPNSVYLNSSGDYIPSITVRYGLHTIPQGRYQIERIDKSASGTAPKVGTARIRVSVNRERLSGSITMTVPVEISGTAKSSGEYRLGKANESRPFDNEFQPFADTYVYEQLSTLSEIKDKSLTLKQGTDYNVWYKNNAKLGWATAIIMLKGKYSGTITVNYQISKEPEVIKGGKLSGTAKSSKQYTISGGSSAVRPFDKEFKPFDAIYKYSKRSTDLIVDQSLTLKQGTDYTVSYKNNKKKGWATATIKMKGLFSGKLTVKYQIVKNNISGTTKSTKVYKLVGSKAVKPFDKTFQPFATTYNYSSQSTNLTVVDRSLTLKKGTDYTVSYKNNKKEGWATATIKLKGKYTGKITVKYRLVKDKISGTAESSQEYQLVKKKAVKPFDKTFQPFATIYNYSNQSTNLKTNQSLTLKKGTDYTVKYKNNKKVGLATATITLKGKYSGKITVKYKII